MPSLEEIAIDDATRHQVLVERYKSEEARIAEEDSDATEEAILALLVSLRLLGVDDLKKNAIDSAANSIAIRVSSLHDSFVSGLMNRMGDFSAYETRFEVNAIRKLVDQVATVARPANPLPYALGKAMGHSGETVADFLATWKRSEVRAFENAIRKAWLDGIPFTQAIQGTESLAFKDGVLSRIKNWRSTNIKTLMQHISQASKEATWLANPDIANRYRWISILDSRTTNICRSRANNVYTVGEGPIPPAHHRCRSTTVLLPNEQ